MKEKIYYCFEYDDLGYIKGYKFVNNDFVVDEQKKAEIIAEREKEAQKPSRLDRLEAQSFFTAMTTDTLLEEE